MLTASVVKRPLFAVAYLPGLIEAHRWLGGFQLRPVCFQELFRKGFESSGIGRVAAVSDLMNECRLQSDRELEADLPECPTLQTFGGEQSTFVLADGRMRSVTGDQGT